MARRKEISKTKFEEYCRLQCTEAEISSAFEVSEDTLDRWCKRTYGEGFADTFAKKRQGGFISLRRLQYQMAEGGDKTMAIWLGKNWLGQADKVEADIKVEPVNIVFDV